MRPSRSGGAVGFGYLGNLRGAYDWWQGSPGDDTINISCTIGAGYTVQIQESATGSAPWVNVTTIDTAATTWDAPENGWYRGTVMTGPYAGLSAGPVMVNAL